MPYKIYTLPKNKSKNWENAIVHCQGHGMVLARPKSAAENHKINGCLNNLNDTTQSYWFGVFNNTMRTNATNGTYCQMNAPWR